jgi:hypothetical protein
MRACKGRRLGGEREHEATWSHRNQRNTVAGTADSGEYNRAAWRCFEEIDRGKKERTSRAFIGALTWRGG